LALSDVGQCLKFVTGWGKISLVSASGKHYLKQGSKAHFSNGQFGDIDFKMLLILKSAQKFVV